MAENCNFENREEVIIRDIFITNILDDDIQRELFRDTVDPERALSIAVNMEMGHLNQQRISSNNGATGNTVNVIQSFNRFGDTGARGNQSGRVAVNHASVGQCRGCGQALTTTHRQVCPAMGKKCNHCGMLNQFATVCRKKLNNARNSRQNNSINNVETAETTDQNTSQENQNVNYVHYSDNYVATVENVRSPPIALENMTITIGNTDCHLLFDSGSGSTIINMSLAREIMYNCA